MFDLWDASEFSPKGLPSLGLDIDASAQNSVYSDGAAHFTAASSQYLTCPNNSAFQVTNADDFWFFACAYLDSNTGLYRIMNKAAEYALIWNQPSAGFILQVANDSASNAVAQPPSVPLGSWCPVLAWFDKTAKTVNIRALGSAVSSTSYSTAWSATTNPFNVGTYDGTIHFFDGRLDSLVYGKNPPGGIASVISDIWATLSNNGNGCTSAGVTAAQKTAWGGISFWDCNEESGTRFDAWGTNHLTASNTTLISPTVNNGGFESDTGGTIAAPWAVSTPGSSTAVDEGSIVHAGSHAAKLTPTASAQPNISQTLLRAGDIYSYSFWARSASGTTSIVTSNFGASIKSFALSTTYTQYSGNFTSLDTLFGIVALIGTIASYIDDVTLTDLGPVGIAGIAAGLAADGNFCGQFNGTNQYLSVASNSSLQVGNVDAWFSQWVWFDAKSGVMNSFAKYSYSHPFEWKFEYDNSGDVFLFSVSDDGTTQHTITASSFGSPHTSGWIHQFAWYDSVNATLNIRINNGSTDSISYGGGIFVGTAPLGIGAVGSAGLRWWQGRLDTSLFGKSPPSGIAAIASTICSTLFNNGNGLKAKALTAAQIAAWGVVSGWDMDKQLGITADSIGTNTLTNNNGVTFAQGVDYFGGAVSKWLDQSGNGNNAIQTTEALRPVYYSNMQNGKGSLYFSGTTFLSLLSNLANTPVTIFVITEHTVTGFGAMVGGDPVGGLEYRFDNSDKLQLVRSAVGNIAESNTVISKSAFSLVDMSYDGTNYLFGLNGVDDGSGTSASAFSSHINQIGTVASGAENYTGYIARILIYGSVLTTGQRQLVRNYLKSQYGIS